MARETSFERPTQRQRGQQVENRFSETVISLDCPHIEFSAKQSKHFTECKLHILGNTNLSDKNVYCAVIPKCVS